MSEYTPTTSHVRNTYTVFGVAEDFDRWLASVKADAFDYCAQEAHDLGWLHEDALADVQRRNPWRGEQA
jgi:hypothetical protein